MGYPCPVTGPIPVALPNTSMITNQHIAFDTHVHIQVFHILHNHTMKLLQVFTSFLTWKFVIENQQQNQIC